MGLLKGSSAYLIGSVDHHKNPNKWRKDITKDLLNPLGVNVYNPLMKPSWFQEEYPLVDNVHPSKDFELFKAVLNNRECKEFTDITPIENRMNAVRELCLRMANDCNFIIGFVPKKFTVGTWEEFGVAALSKKPILLYLPEGYDTSTWIPAQLNKSLNRFFEDSFTNIDDLYNRVKSIDSGDAKVNNLEWLFLSYFNNKDIKNELSIY